MNQTTIDRLKEYEKLMLQKRALENELEILKEELVPELPRGKEIATENGVFNISSRDKWTYSIGTQALDKKLKDLQKLEQQSGVATSEQGEPFLVYRSVV